MQENYTMQNMDNPYQGYVQYIAPPKEPIPFKSFDRLLALLTFVLGFVFWKWGILFYPSPGLGTMIFFVLAIALGLFYMQYHGVKQNTNSLICLAILIASLLPFILYDRIEIEVFLILFIITMYVIWLAYSCNTNISKNISGFVVGDLANQLFVVPFSNFGMAFICLFKRNKEDAKEKKAFSAIIGVLVSIPIITVVIALLIAADDGFYNLTKSIPKLFTPVQFANNIAYLIFGIPVACYIFGSIAGNSNKRKTDSITKENTANRLAKSHKIPTPSIYAPLAIFNLLYVIFFIAMGAYLFSAFSGELPAAYTYAEYARKGFFELCGVAAINLVIIIFAYCFTRREPKQYPQKLRYMTCFLSVMTILLIATAMSKMLLYIGAYDLTRLRVYTLWFMILLLIVFLVILIWHAKPFNAGKPIVVTFVALVLILFLSNTDGLIAKYNVEQYETGRSKDIDIEMMTYMSDAVDPYLQNLMKNAPDENIRKKAEDTIAMREDMYFHYADEPKYFVWNMQSARLSSVSK